MKSLFVTPLLLVVGPETCEAVAPYHRHRTVTIRILKRDQADCDTVVTPRSDTVKSGWNGTPAAATAPAPPSSRSTTQIAAQTSSSASRSASTAARSAPPDVTTSSTTHTRCPAS